MTAPPDFSQSSTPFRLLAPRHPPHALTSLAALFASSTRVATREDRETLNQLASISDLLESRPKETMLPFSSKARVLSLALRPSTPTRPSREETRRDQDASNQRCNFLPTELSKIAEPRTVARLAIHPATVRREARSADFRRIRWEGADRYLCRFSLASPFQVSRCVHQQGEC